MMGLCPECGSLLRASGGFSGLNRGKKGGNVAVRPWGERRAGAGAAAGREQ